MNLPGRHRRSGRCRPRGTQPKTRKWLGSMFVLLQTVATLAVTICVAIGPLNTLV